MEREHFSPQSDITCLPTAILSDILIRLPIETIGLCRTLSKLFYKLTKDPYFIEQHLQRSKCQSPLILISPIHSEDHSNNKHYWVCFDQGRFVEIPQNGLFGPDLLAGASCNGLLCMLRSFYVDIDPLVIYNPITMESAELPKSRFMAGKKYYPCICFGYDDVHKKYKVVRLSTVYNSGVAICTGEIITLGDSSWRQLVLPPGVTQLDCNTNIFHNGAFYWEYSFGDKDKILVLEISNEMFHTIEFSPPPLSPKLRPNPVAWCYARIIHFGEFVGLVEKFSRPPRGSTSHRMWKITGNSTAGFQFCCETLDVSSVKCEPGHPGLWFSDILSDGSYLFTGLKKCNGDETGLVALLSQPKNEEGSVRVQYAAGGSYPFNTLFVLPSLVSPSTLIRAQDQQVEFITRVEGMVINFVNKLSQILQRANKFSSRIW